MPKDPWMAALIIIAIIWTLCWKGVALWKAGRNNQPVWFITLLVINSLGILEIAYIFFFHQDKNQPCQASLLPEMTP